MTNFDKAVCWIAIFSGGVVTAVNLSLLMPLNPNYEASWLNVILAITLALYFPSTRIK